MFARATTTICLTALLVLQLIVQAHCRSTGGDYSAETRHRLHHHHQHRYHHHHKHHHNNHHRQDEQLQFETKQLLRLAEDDDNNGSFDEASLVPLSRVRREPPRLPELDGNDQSQSNSEEEDDYGGRASRYRDRSGRHRRPTESPSKQAHNSNGTTDDPFLYDISAAHGKTVCPYEIVPVPEEPGREPRNLLHLTCLRRGSTCRGVPDKKSNGVGKDKEGAFCCIQLYRDIELRWDGGRPNTWLRLDSGCVCTEKKYMPLRRFESGADVDLDE